MRLLLTKKYIDMSDKILSTVYDHYKDTCSVIGEAIKRRDRLMLFVLAVLSFLAFQNIFPAISGVAINDFLNFKLGLTFRLDFSVIGSFTWFLLLLFTLRYFQLAVFVERQYSYLHKIEGRLNKELGEEIITREGKSYLSNYPCFSNWMWLLYTIIFPYLLFLAIATKIANELRDALLNGWSVHLVLDATAFILLSISIVLYLFMLHIKKAK